MSHGEDNMKLNLKEYQKLAKELMLPGPELRALVGPRKEVIEMFCLAAEASGMWREAVYAMYVMGRMDERKEGEKNGS